MLDGIDLQLTRLAADAAAQQPGFRVVVRLASTPDRSGTGPRRTLRASAGEPIDAQLGDAEPESRRSGRDGPRASSACTSRIDSSLVFPHADGQPIRPQYLLNQLPSDHRRGRLARHPSPRSAAPGRDRMLTASVPMAGSKTLRRQNGATTIDLCDHLAQDSTEDGVTTARGWHSIALRPGPRNPRGARSVRGYDLQATTSPNDLKGIWLIGVSLDQTGRADRPG
jgi:hypothetical protein